VMGERSLKQALIDLGRLPDQILHGLPLLSRLFRQYLKRRTVILGLGLQGLRWSLDQASGANSMVCS
jgi:hypothetical protein